MFSQRVNTKKNKFWMKDFMLVRRENVKAESIRKSCIIFKLFQLELKGIYCLSESIRIRPDPYY